MLKKPIFILISLLLYLPGHSSDYLTTLDSLQSELDSAEGIERAEILYKLARHTAPWDSVLCIQYINKQKELIKDSDDPILWGNLWQNMGEYYYFRDDYINALENLSKCADIFGESGDVLNEGISYYEIILVFFNSGNAGHAMRYLPKMSMMEDNTTDTNMMIGSLWGSAYFHNNVTGDYEESKKLLGSALKLADEYHASSVYKGGLYASYALACNRLDQTDSTYFFNRKALAIFANDKLDDRLMKMQVLCETGNYYYWDNIYDSALHYLNRSLEIADQMTSVFMKAVIHLYLGRTYHRLNDLEQAEEHYIASVQKSLETIKTGRAYTNPDYRFVPFHAWDVIMKTMTPRMVKRLTYSRLLTSYLCLSEMDEQAGRFNESLEWLKKKQGVRQRLNEYEKSDELLGIRLRYETEKKDKQITLLSRENEMSKLQVSQTRSLLAGLGGLVILIVIIALLFIRQNRLRSQQKTLLLEQKLLRSQMNPQFISNALSNISNLIDKNDNATASRFLTRFSRLVRHILESTRTDQISLDEEITNLENYLAIQQLRFGEKFDYKISIEDEIDPEDYVIPTMLIQPFVENAIEHGIKPKKGRGEVNVRMKTQNGMLICEVEDDGIGRESAMQLRKKEHPSLATSITRERLTILNRKLRRKVSLKITDLKTDVGVSLGTRVRIGIPII